MFSLLTLLLLVILVPLLVALAVGIFLLSRLHRFMRNDGKRTYTDTPRNEAPKAGTGANDDPLANRRAIKPGEGEYVDFEDV